MTFQRNDAGDASVDMCADYIRGIDCASGLFLQWESDGDCRCCDAEDSMFDYEGIHVYRLVE